MDAERLIEEIEARPGLFDKSLPEYANKKIKDSLWMDVTRTLVEEWDDLSEVEKNVQCKEVQLKWKHIRDNFRRELQAQKKLNHGAKKKRKYKYFDQMLFLIPYVNDGIATGNSNNQSDCFDIDTKRENSTLVEVEILDSSPNTNSPPSMNRPPPRNTYTRNKYTSNSFTSNIIKPRRNKKKTTFEEEILKSLKSRDNLDTDEDRTFCLSLVSSIKKMNDATKLNAKIDILKIIRQYTVPQVDAKPKQTTEDSFPEHVSKVKEI